MVKDGKEEAVYDAEHVQRSKLRVDARKWFASKVAPAKYGDKQTIDLNAKVQGTVAQNQHQTRTLMDEQLGRAGSRVQP